MTCQIAPPQVIGPYAPWPHVGEDPRDMSKSQAAAFNPARHLRGPVDHQADCQLACQQAR